MITNTDEIWNSTILSQYIDLKTEMSHCHTSSKLHSKLETVEGFPKKTTENRSSNRLL